MTVKSPERMGIQNQEDRNQKVEKARVVEA